MPYVMVPVPEEHVEAVMQFVVRSIGRASEVPWDSDAVQETFDAIDEMSRSLIAFVARSTVDDRELDIEEGGRLLQLTPREVMSVANAMSAQNREDNRPPLLRMRSAAVKLPNGRTTERRLLWMDPDIAELVRKAEQDELARNPLPFAEPGA
jgi:hypothetical protein